MLRRAVSRALGFIETRWAAPTVFVAGLCVWWIQAIAMPLARGRDFGTYVGAYVELFQHDPIDLGYVLGRTPIAPLVTGALLDVTDGALAEPVMSVLYALSITAWFVAARRFGPLAAMLMAVVLLAYPSYGILFHELASDSIFAAAFAGWSLLAVSTVLTPTPLRFGLVGAGIGLLVLVRPGNQALLVLALVPLVLALSWRTRIASALALVLAASALLGLWAVHNGVLYGKYTVATGGNSRLPFERAFLTDRIVRPENGPASERLADLVQRELLPEEPYRSYGIGLDDFFADPSPRMIVDLTSLSNRLWGWKSDARILRDVGIEAVRAHPGPYARGVSTTVFDLLWQPVFRSSPPAGRAAAEGDAPTEVEDVQGETVVINGRRLPKPTEGERIPRPHEQAPTTPEGGNYTVWTSATERHVVYRSRRDEERVKALGRRISELAANLPDRTGNGTFALRINQASHRFPPPVVWLGIGIVALVIRRPIGALAAMTPAIAGLIVIVLNALAIPAVPHYSVPVAPSFVLLAAAALCSRSMRDASSTVLRSPEP
jgi:hypothetical protein